MMKELETSRLNLRRLSMEDLYDYYERLMSDGEVTKYTSLEPHQDIGESLEAIERTLQRYEDGDCCLWAVVLKEDERLIGTIELLDIREKEKSGSFLCLLAKKWWNRGYATEAVKEVFRFATEELGIRKIRADHMAHNTAAGRVMEKVGMKQVAWAADQYDYYGRSVLGVVYELDLADAEPLTANEYQKLAMTTLNPDLAKKDVLINGVMGLCGEAGECIDLVKKHLFQGHNLDREQLCKELGDVAWYLAEAAWALDVDLEQILRGNLDKLRKRYPRGFENERSINR